MKSSLIRFYAVGLAGVAVQLGALALLTSGLHVNYLIATAAAVETAVVHNFLWHDRWTWPGRPASERLVRFLRFNASNGAISILFNVFITGALVSIAGLPYIVANSAAIAGASVANYLAGDRYVFAMKNTRSAILNG